MQIENKIAIITGAGSGIGRAISILFAKEGAKVMLVDYDKESLLQTGEEVSRYKQKYSLFHKDVSIPIQVEEVVKRTIRRYGGIDVLVNNAGIAVPGKITDIDYSDFRKMIDTNLGGIYLFMYYALPYMRMKKKGKIINISSDLGLKGTRNGAVYSATKHAIIGLTKSAALDEKEYGIKINTVCPDAVDTPLLREFRTKEMIEEIIKKMPNGILQPETVAEKILYIASDKFKMTGQVIYINK